MMNSESASQQPEVGTAYARILAELRAIQVEAATTRHLVTQLLAAQLNLDEEAIDHKVSEAFDSAHHEIGYADYMRDNFPPKSE